VPEGQHPFASLYQSFWNIYLMCSKVLLGISIHLKILISHCTRSPWNIDATCNKILGFKRKVNTQLSVRQKRALWECEAGK
jgi:hypothetical protein